VMVLDLLSDRILGACLLQAISSNKPASVAVVDQNVGNQTSDEQRSFRIECKAAQDARDARKCACEEAANIFRTVIARKENLLSRIGLPPQPRTIVPMLESGGRITYPMEVWRGWAQKLTKLHMDRRNPPWPTRVTNYWPSPGRTAPLRVGECA
jgi:hypothetical protein